MIMRLAKAQNIAPAVVNRPEEEVENLPPNGSVHGDIFDGAIFVGARRVIVQTEAITSIVDHRHNELRTSKMLELALALSSWSS